MKHKYCKNCGALNRIAKDKLEAKTASCGRCSSELSHLESVDNVSEEQAQKLLRNADGLVVVDVYAQWCGPCKTYSPVFSKVGAQNYRKAEFIKLDADHAPNFSSQFGIRGVPATLFFKNGKLVNQRGGLLSEAQLDQEIQAWA